jgi:hypothetical protein
MRARSCFWLGVPEAKEDDKAEESRQGQIIVHVGLPFVKRSVSAMMRMDGEEWGAIVLCGWRLAWIHWVVRISYIVLYHIVYNIIYTSCL